MYICRFKDMYINRIMLYTSAIIFKSLDLLLFTCSSLNQSIIRKYLPQIFISLLQKISIPETSNKLNLTF